MEQHESDLGWQKRTGVTTGRNRKQGWTATALEERPARWQGRGKGRHRWVLRGALLGQRQGELASSWLQRLTDSAGKVFKWHCCILNAEGAKASCGLLFNKSSFRNCLCLLPSYLLCSLETLPLSAIERKDPACFRLCQGRKPYLEGQQCTLRSGWLCSVTCHTGLLWGHPAMPLTRGSHKCGCTHASHTLAVCAPQVSDAGDTGTREQEHPPLRAGRGQTQARGTPAADTRGTSQRSQ